MARTNEWTETLVDWVDGRLRQNRFSNLWLGGGAGADGGSSYRPIDGQLTQRHVCYDTSETASPCSPSGFSSLVDNLRRIRYWQEPATWFGAETTSGLKITIKPGLWYPSTTEYCAFAGGDSPTFTLPAALDRIDTVYIDASGILHIQRGTPAVSPTITLPPIASGIPLWAVYLPPTASGVYFQVCSGYYAGQAYIERDLRPFLNLGGVAASGVLPASNRGAILRGGVADWETYNIGVANTILTNDGTDIIWSSKTLTIEENSILNQDLTTDASVTFADVFVPNGGTFGISGNELLTVNAAGNFTFSGITSIVVPNGVWVGADASCAWLFDSGNGDITAQDDVGIGTTAPEGKLDVAYSGGAGKVTLLLGADFNATTRTNNTNKYTLIGSYHYINAEEPVGMMRAYSSNIVSRLDIGGGNINCNAATEVSIYTAANTTTPTGTNRFSVTSTGAITVTGPSFTVPAAWNLIVPDNAADALGLDDAGGLEYMRIVSTNANPYFLIDPTGAGVKVGIGASRSTAHLAVIDATLDTTTNFEGIYNQHIKTAGVTDVNDLIYGIYSIIQLNQAAGTTGSIYGQHITAQITAGNVGNAANARGLYGILGIADLNGGKIWGDVYGLQFSVDQEAANEVTGNIIGAYISVDADGTVGGTSYTLYVHALTNVDYAVYQAGNVKNYFAGDVGIGVAVPLAKCHVDQASTTAAIPVLILDQADISEGFINFIGSDRGVITQNVSSLTSVRVELGGVVYRLALYVDA